MKRLYFSILMILFTVFLYSQESAISKKQTDKPFIAKYERSKGYCGWVEAGINMLPLGKQPQNRPDPFPAPSLRFFNGARLGRFVSLGIETGLDAGTQVPVDVKMRVNVLKRKVTPIFDLALGYSYFFLSGKDNAFNFSPSFGLKVNCKRASFTFRAAYYDIVSRALADGGYHLDSPMYDQPAPLLSHCYGMQAMAGVEF